MWVLDLDIFLDIFLITFALLKWAGDLQNKIEMDLRCPQWLSDYFSQILLRIFKMEVKRLQTSVTQVRKYRNPAKLIKYSDEIIFIADH